LDAGYGFLPLLTAPVRHPMMYKYPASYVGKRWQYCADMLRELRRRVCAPKTRALNTSRFDVLND
jgi:hypothetical protein